LSRESTNSTFQGAETLAKELLNVDDSILSLAIIDSKGERIATEWKRDRSPWEGRHLNPQDLSKMMRTMGSSTNVILDIAKNHEKLFGEFEGASINWSGYQATSLKLDQRMNLRLTLLIQRSANIEYIFAKVRSAVLRFESRNSSAEPKTRILDDDRILRVSRALSRHPYGMTLSELLKELNVSRYTALRWLAAMKNDGLIRKSYKVVERKRGRPKSVYRMTEKLEEHFSSL
jgi:hypothetical protein